MWNRIKERASIDSRRNIVHELVNQLRQENKLDQIEESIKQLAPNSLNKKENEIRFHLLGLHASRRQQHQEAIHHFQEGLKFVPNSHLLKFFEGQEYIFLRTPRKAFEIFDECHFPMLPSEYILKMSHYAYIYDQYDRGMDYITEFVPTYVELKNLDDHFLATRGLPFFNVVWDHLAVHGILSHNKDRVLQLSNTIKENCSEYDFNYLDAKINAYLGDDSNQLNSLLSSYVAQEEQYGVQYAYNRLQLLCFNYVDIHDYDEALGLLDSIAIEKNDFSWLGDVILLAKAVAANKFDKSYDEEEYIEQFLRNQPYLFGPEIILPFAFLPYQEKLKKIIR
jgi:hypothetical protein